MACNCVTEKQLDELFKKYGGSVDTKNMKTPEKIKYFTTKIGASLMMIVIAPILFGYVLYKSFSKDKRISLKRFFNLKEISFEEYVEQQRRKQQNMQDKDKR